MIRFETTFILNLNIQAQGVNESAFRLFFELFDYYIRKFGEYKYKYKKLMRILLIVLLSVNDIFETEMSLTVKRFG